MGGLASKPGRSRNYKAGASRDALGTVAKHLALQDLGLRVKADGASSYRSIIGISVLLEFAAMLLGTATTRCNFCPDSGLELPVQCLLPLRLRVLHSARHHA